MSPDDLDPLCLALGLGPSARAILGEVAALYAEVDRELAQRSAGLELPCGAGCSDCCHESVFLSAPEFLAAVAELQRRPRAEVERIVDEMVRLAERFADELELLETLPPGPERLEVASRVKFRCPLLDAGGRCEIYAGRELNARSFGQSYDARGGAPYGCERTLGRLRVLGDEVARGLPDARGLRQRLVDRLPSGPVQVYPWWFRRYRAEVLAAFASSTRTNT